MPTKIHSDCPNPHHVSFINGLLFGQENGRSRLQQTQEEVEEVTVIMLDNLNKANERSGKLGELENRADQLLVKVSGRSSEKHIICLVSL